MSIKEARTTSNSFSIVINGRLESALCTSAPNRVYCRYSFRHGSEWKAATGITCGVSQVARPHGGCWPRSSIVFNFPIDVSFETTNVSGWPRIVVSLYGIDAFGRDGAIGFATVLCPMAPGTYVQHTPLFALTSTSFCQRLINWFDGVKPEYYDAEFIAQGAGRATTVVEHVGSITMILNVVTRHMNNCGYLSEMVLRGAK